LSLRSPLLLCLLAWLAAAQAAAAPQPYLFADLLRGVEVDGSSVPSFFRQPVGGRTLFVADDGHFGRELWATDGTAGGTHLLADLCPGSCGFIVRDPLVVDGDLAFFVTYDSAAASRTLWRTDGTTRGTAPLATSGELRALESIVWMPRASRLLFAHGRAAEGVEPWVSDGSAEGTVPLLDLRPGREGSQPALFLAVGPRVYFRADDGVHGSEPWSTDGTAGGTRLVADLEPGSAGSAVEPIGVAGGRLFLAARPGVTGRGLWTTDGTAAGTRRVRHFEHGFLRALTDGHHVYLFAAADGGPAGAYHLWSSDGTAAGTRPLTPEATLDSDEVFTRTPTPLAGGLLLFDWQRDGSGLEPWVTDGTPAGTIPLADVCPGACPSRRPRSQGADYYVHDGLAFFDADDGGHGREAWITDGSPAGTRRLLDACPGPCHGSGGGLDADVTPHGVLMTFADGDERGLWLADGGGAAPRRLLAGGVTGLWDAAARPGDPGLYLGLGGGTDGVELWRSDLTAAGTELLRNLNSGHDAGSRPRRFTVAAGELYFVTEAETGEPPRLWRSDGTPAGTVPLGGLPAAAEEALGDPRALWIGTSSHLFALRRIDGPGAGGWTAVALDAAAGDWSELAPGGLGFEAAFVATDDILVGVGDGVWVSDGTAAGSRRFEAAEGGSVHAVAALGGAAVFAGRSTQNLLLHLWRADGGGVVPLRALGEEGGEQVEAMTVFSGEVVFLFAGRLWASDGTPSGTRSLFELPFGERVEALHALDERLLLVTESGRAWSTSGGVGDLLELDVEVGGGAFPLGERLLFEGFRDTGPVAWWVSDGTAAGTAPLAGSLVQVDPLRSRGHRVGDHVVVVERLADGRWGAWSSDGTDEGSHRLATFDAEPVHFARLGETVFFAAFDRRYGEELWALHLDGEPPRVEPETCAADAETLCLLGGRFRVRARWHDPRTGNEGAAGARPFPGSDRTGVFWFFHPDNVELIVKQLDGRGLNGFFWTFWGALTDVEYWIEVDELETGARRTFHNPPLEVCGRGDTTAFPAAASSRAGTVAAAAAICDAPGTLCLHGGRFAVDVDWRDPRTGNAGTGTAIPGTDRSGYFWFFRGDNVELVVKVLDGRPVNGRFWVFYGALTDVEYTLRVRDLEGGGERSYHNPPGTICGEADTEAF
jgi:ELWxxDGT repeat protein